MKSPEFFAKTFHSLRSTEANVVAVTLLREGIFLSLGSLVILLSLEGLLPGTVSLRTGILFFILLISIALLAERTLSSTLPATSIENTRTLPTKMEHAISILFFTWATFLLGSSLIGFHPVLIIVILIVTIPLLRVFSTLEDTSH